MYDDDAAALDFFSDERLGVVWWFEEAESGRECGSEGERVEERPWCFWGYEMFGVEPKDRRCGVRDMWSPIAIWSIEGGFREL